MSVHPSNTSKVSLNKMQGVHIDPIEDVEEGSSANYSLVPDGNKDKTKTNISGTMFVLRYQVWPLVLLLLIDLAIPLAIYYIFRIFTTDVIALIVSGVPPLLRVLYILIRHHRIDIISCIFVVSFVVSGVLSIVNGDARIALLRDSFTTAIIGIAFLATLIPIRFSWLHVYPLTHLIGREFLAGAPTKRWQDKEGNRYEEPLPVWIWNNVSRYRKLSYALTAAWGLILLGEFALRVALIYTGYPIDRIVYIGTCTMIAIFVTMGVITTFLSTRIRKISMNAWKKFKVDNDIIEINEQGEPIQC